MVESATPFTGEFSPLEWLTSAVVLSTDDAVEWSEDAVVQLSLPLSGGPAVSAQAFEVGNSVGIIRIAGAPDEMFGPTPLLYGMPRLNTSTGFVDFELPAGLMSNSTGLNARDLQVRIAGNVVEYRKNFWPAQEGLWRVVQSKVPLERDEFEDACRLNSLDDLLTQDLRGPSSTAVIMVHGWQTFGQFASGGDNIENVVHCKGWIDVMSAFHYHAEDWQDLRENADLFTFRYNSDERIIASGAKLATAVDDLYDLGYGTVVLLGHSMGGLVSVEARQQLEYPAYLAGIVTLGTPFMGGVLGCVQQSTLVVVPDPDVVDPNQDAETFCTRLIAPEALVTGVLDFIVPAGGSYDLTQYKPWAPFFSVGNPYLKRLWDGEGSRNFEN
ncbi:MAG: GPI inositol-deacylase, partial [Thioalkalivibrio sp.]|nr:GPI inositol-deacylase [Thioalkalivibrio sp.]